MYAHHPHLSSVMNSTFNEQKATVFRGKNKIENSSAVTPDIKQLSSVNNKNIQQKTDTLLTRNSQTQTGIDSNQIHQKSTSLIRC